MNSLSAICPLCDGAARFNFVKYGRDFYVCGGCGLEFIHPQSSAEEIAALYDKSYYDSWGLGGSNDSTERMKQATFHDKLDTMEAFMPSKGRVLDIGCATGFFLEAARERGWVPYGVELSEYSSGIARQKIGPERIVTGRVEEAGFGGAAFDAIVMTDVIEHVSDVRSFLAEIARILKPGGIVAITTPNPAGLLCRMLGSHWPHYKLEHLMYYTPAALARLLEPLGLRQLYAAAATKTLTLAYLDLQMRTYPVPLVTPLVGLLASLLPAAANRARFRIYSGELFLVSRREGDGAP